MSQLKTAPVNMFTTLRPRLYVGQWLKDIKTVQASISRFGLLSPILVSRSKGRLIVLDGRKRLAAIRRLEFMGQLPRSLVNIPYIEVSDAQDSVASAPQLMSNRELFTTVTWMFKQTQNVEHIAEQLYLSRKCVKQILTLTRLSSRLRRAFFDRTIDFSRAKAYAALPKHAVQNDVFMALGPFATAEEILKYVSAPAKSNQVLSLAA
jgi:hypothetical protein